jgi:hypothetical protein
MARKELSTELTDHVIADAELGGDGRLCGSGRLGWSCEGKVGIFFFWHGLNHEQRTKPES